MIFADKTKDLIEQSIMIAKNNANNSRKQQIQEWDDYYDGNQLGYIEKYTTCPDTVWDRRPKIAFPFTRLILEDLGMLYKKPPNRTFGKSDEDPLNGIYTDWLTMMEEDDGNAHFLMQIADDKTRLFGNMAIEVVPSLNPDEQPILKRDEIYPRFNLYSPDQIDIIQDPDRPNKAVAVILQLSSRDTLGNSDNIFRIWTPDKQIKLINGKVEYDKDNDLKTIPVIFFANTLEHQCFWSEGYGNRIVNQNKIFDRIWTSLIWLAIVQCHGIPVGKQVDPRWAENPILEPDVIARVGADGDLNFRNPNPAIQDIISVAEKIVERTYWLCGLPVANFLQTTMPESGYAHMVKNMKVLEDREKRASVFGPKERKLWRLAFQVMKTWVNPSLEVPQEIKIDYEEPSFPVPTQERLEEIKWKMENHLVSVVDLMRQEDPDLATPEEAEKKLMENKRINEQIFNVKKASVTDLLKEINAGQEEEEII